MRRTKRAFSRVLFLGAALAALTGVDATLGRAGLAHMSDEGDVPDTLPVSGSDIANVAGDTGHAKPIDLAMFSKEIAVVEEALSGADGVSRDDGLAIFGRTSAASGRFDVGAAAYAMFLSEFGTTHEYSERIALRLADCLFPFDYSDVSVSHEATGPVVNPHWRMGYTPRSDRLEAAVEAYELVSSIASDGFRKDTAMFRLGWVHRVLGDWRASTAAWERCGEVASAPKWGADALWLASQNLEWTDRPTEAAELLDRFRTKYPNDARIGAVDDRVEWLTAEAERSSDWLDDPVASLEAEIEHRTPARSPQDVYRSVLRWLRRHGEREAALAVTRWACTQAAWPAAERLRSHYDLVDALLTPGKDIEQRQHEAAQVLRAIGEFAPDLDSVLRAGVKRYHLLDGLAMYDEADQLMDDLLSRANGSFAWEPPLLIARIESLLARGENERAKQALQRLQHSYPGLELEGRVEALCGSDDKEDSR